MPLDPRAEQLLAELARNPWPPLDELTPQIARQLMDEASAALGEKEPVDSITDRVVLGSECEIPVRVYRPGGENLPIVVYFHGGGWVIGSVDSHDGYCRALANAAKAIVVSVDYRLAPEHRFPAAAEDAYETAYWVGQNTKALGGRSGPIIVAGDSAGGNLAAALAQMARDRGGPSIASQILIYPVVDSDFETGSYREFAEDYFLTREAMMWFWDHYCPETSHREHAYASPLRADDLSDLPPAVVITAEYDPLRDEAELYAGKLQEAGVNTQLSRYDGMLHGFTRRLTLFDQAKQALDEVAAAIQTSG